MGNINNKQNAKNNLQLCTVRDMMIYCELSSKLQTITITNHDSLVDFQSQMFNFPSASPDITKLQKCNRCSHTYARVQVHVKVSACLRACSCVHVCACVCMCVCVCACVRACVCVHKYNTYYVCTAYTYILHLSPSIRREVYLTSISSNLQRKQQIH